MNCIFCKIVNNESPAKIVYQNDDVMVFPDIHPVKPIHLLIVTKKHYKDLVDVLDRELFGKLLSVVQEMAKQHGLSNKGYRVVVNGGGAQIVDHLHIHLMGPVGKAVSL